MTTFNGVLQSHTYDHGQAEFYRQQDEARRTREHTERSARWIAGKLSGHQYDSLAGLQRAVVELVTDWQGGDVPDDEMMETIRRASVLLWMGQVDRDAMYRRCVERSESGIKFEAA